MNRFKGYIFLFMFVATFLLIGELALAQQSTTGPVPPPGIDYGIRALTSTQVIIPGVPAYLWHHGCGPTAVGMVVGYWDGNGFPSLVPGSAATQTASVDAMIADDSGNPNCAAPDGDHYQDYSCPIDYWPTLLTDRSQTGGAHASNCVADFMMTSWSSQNNFYGWSWFVHVPMSFTNYVNLVAPHYNPLSQNRYYSGTTWATYKAEIDSGRPVVLLVDTDGDGSTDHFVTGIGYDDATNEYGIRNTWDTGIHWYTWRGVGYAWGIYGITLFKLRFMCGDVNGDQKINNSDPLYLANYKLKGGPAPASDEAADVNCDTNVDLGDALIIAKYYYGIPGFTLNCCP